nr:hypothetical protein Iba_chr03bCG0560 [Ipomoea batatas]GMC73365.1 hypothetical protein Iba_chr03cCG0820 [Ipomoea batatas]
MPTWPALADLLVVVSRLGGGLQTSGSSIGPDEVGYSSSGWKTKDDDLVEIGGENGRLPAGTSLKDLFSASSCFTTSVSSDIAFFTFIHFERSKGSSTVLTCLEIKHNKAFILF